MNVKKIWINRKLIWEGFLNNTWRKPKIESEATKRYIICRQCKSFDPKLRSMESECPLGKWHAKTKEI